MEREYVLQFDVRRMQLDDEPAVHALLRTLHRQTYTNNEIGVTADKIDKRFQRFTPEERRDNLAKRLHNPRVASFVATDRSGEVIAMAGPRLEDDGTHRLGALYVAEEWQGKGVAHDLMTHALKWLDADHYDVKLGVVSYNARAKAFYRKWGFEEVPDSDELFDNLIPEVTMIRKAKEMSDEV